MTRGGLTTGSSYSVRWRNVETWRYSKVVLGAGEAESGVSGAKQEICLVATRAALSLTQRKRALIVGPTFICTLRWWITLCLWK